MSKQKQKEKLIFEQNVIPYSLGKARFHKMDMEKLENMLEKGFINIEEYVVEEFKISNEIEEIEDKKVSVKDFISIAQEIVNKSPNLKKSIFFTGYLSKEKVVIEGMEIEKNPEEINSNIKNILKNKFKDADCLEIKQNEFWCWYDN